MRPPHIRVCLDCYWIYDFREFKACAKCGSENYEGARKRYGKNYWKYIRDQPEWFDNQMFKKRDELMYELYGEDYRPEPMKKRKRRQFQWRYVRKTLK